MAIEASDITLIGGDLRGVVNAIALSRSTIASIRQNLFWGECSLLSARVGPPLYVRSSRILMLPFSRGMLWRFMHGTIVPPRCVNKSTD